MKEAVDGRLSHGCVHRVFKKISDFLDQALCVWKKKQKTILSCKVQVFLYFLFRARAQLALGSLRGIFMETMLYHVQDGGLDVCVDLKGSSSLTQTGLTDFVPGRAMSDAAHRAQVKKGSRACVSPSAVIEWSMYQSPQPLTTTSQRLTEGSEAVNLP
ncbi:hypothetical protein Tco_1271176 [Tanacetum coccineum]